jgi:hypothetical protein
MSTRRTVTAPRQIAMYLAKQLTDASLPEGVTARVCREMGYHSIQTYTLVEEPGTSLKASGWVSEGFTKGDSHDTKMRKDGRNRSGSHLTTGPKHSSRSGQSKAWQEKSH